MLTKITKNKKQYLRKVLKMSTDVIVGTQWGDEGKGKITDLLSKDYDIIARYQGGCNAGHTVVVGKEQFIFHLLPSGILHQKTLCLIGNGVVLDLEALFEEIDFITSRGINIEGRLFVDLKTHIILPYHKIIDRLNEEKKGKNKIGTTTKGIGPAYVDKYSRSGIRVCDIIHADRLENKLNILLEQKQEYLYQNYQVKLSPDQIKEIKEKCHNYGEKIKNFSIDGSLFLYENIKKQKNILFEGAQGVMLDVDHGTYPYVTSSNPIAGGVCTGCGITPLSITRIIGIAKAYTTRVGSGPFPTELSDETGEKMREYGHEYGATTGRPRRCGWFDAPVVKYANRINGISEIVLTKLDVLNFLSKIRICKEYKIDNKIYKYFPADSYLAKQIEPVYEEFDGWDEDISNVENYRDLPKNAKKYVEAIEKTIDCKVSIISVGPERDMTIIR